MGYTRQTVWKTAARSSARPETRCTGQPSIGESAILIFEDFSLVEVSSISELFSRCQSGPLPRFGQRARTHAQLLAHVPLERRGQCREQLLDAHLDRKPRYALDQRVRRALHRRKAAKARSARHDSALRSASGASRRRSRS